MLYEEPIGYKSNARVRASMNTIMYYPFHLHPEDIELICVMNGTVTIFDSAVSHKLSYGDVYVFNPNDPHKIFSDDKENLVLSIHMNRTYFEQFYADLEYAYFICDSFTNHDYYLSEVRYLRFLMAKIYTLYTSDANSDFSLELEARDMLAHLYRHFRYYTYKKNDKGNIQIVRISDYAHTYRNYERMYRIVDYISDHFSEKISLSSIAEQEYITSSHLSRYIKQTLGLTFSEVLAVTRCEEAERLLASSNMTVDAIASACGFSTRKPLATQFRKWFGMTPTAYRHEIEIDLDREVNIIELPFNKKFADDLLSMYLDEY